jgi:ATP-dependent RNA helicase DBP3
MQKYHQKGNRVLVFVLYKKEAPRIERLLKGKGYKVGAVHGDMSQYDRTQVCPSRTSALTPIFDTL